jgi:hypothetical protein
MGKKSVRSISTNELGVVVHSCFPSCEGSPGTLPLPPAKEKQDHKERIKKRGLEM